MSEHLDVMKGFPPPEEGQVSLSNWRDPPYNRWSFHHIPQILLCAPIWGAEERAPDWAADLQEIGEVKFKWYGKDITVAEMLEQTLTDGLIVLKNGRLVYSMYTVGMSSRDPHILFSVTKSVVGLAAGIMVAAGELNVDRRVSEYVPEIRNAGYAEATVRQLLDMTVGVQFDEDYLAPSSDMARYREASGWNAGDPRKAIGLRKFVTTIPGPHQHGVTLRYCSPNTDLMAWILERASGQPLAEFLSMHLWQPMGAWDLALLAVDGYGAPRGSGGLSTSTRDMARLGDLVLNMGALGTKQIVPESWIADIHGGGDAAAWQAGSFAEGIKDTTYRSYWYKYGVDDWAIGAFGIYGQALYVHPATRIVIAKHSSYPVPLDFQRENLQRAAFKAVTQALS